MVRVESNISDTTLTGFSFSLDTVAGNTAKCNWANPFSTFTSIAAGSTQYYRKRCRISQCPPGSNTFQVRFTYSFQVGGTGETYTDTAFIGIPVIGPSLFPVLQFMSDTTGDLLTKANDSISMVVTLTNRYPATVLNARCSLEVNNAYITLDTAVSGTYDSVKVGTVADDGRITFKVSSAYNEENDGIIQAKLHIFGENMQAHVYDIDLNPIAMDNFMIDTMKSFSGNNSIIHLSWPPQKYNDKGRNSDFMGYVVIRNYYRQRFVPDTGIDTISELVTLAPITTAEIYDKFPSSSLHDSIEYLIYTVDSSSNLSSAASYTVSRAYPLKQHFPIVTNDFLRTPAIGNHDKDNNAEIYSVASANTYYGNVIGYRADGQEVLVGGANDGTIYGGSNAWQAVYADINNNGYDELVFTTHDSVIVWDIVGDSLLWKVFDADTPHSQKENDQVNWFVPPVVADINKDGTFEFIVAGMDNNGDVAKTGALSIDAYNHAGMRIGRKTFPDEKSYGYCVAVGEFKDDGANRLEILALANVEDTSVRQHCLYNMTVNGIGGVTVHDTAILSIPNVCDAAGLSVGNLYGSSGVLEIVTAKGNFKDRDHDSILVYTIDTATGAFGSTHAAYQIHFSMWTIFGSVPALGDIDNDGKDDIVFASDDTIYLLKMVSQDSLSLIRKIPFGSVPSNRISQNQYIPQALIADIDNDGSVEIVVNHYGDGQIWAFDVGGALVPRFPLKVKGRVEKACNITDLEGDGKLDLVAVDEAGCIYAWEMDSGSVFAQPWPSKYGNGWNTANKFYKNKGEVGHLYEDWKAARVAPYRWFETGANNTLSETSVAFEVDSAMLITDYAGGYNCHFTGPMMDSLRNYTIEGKFKFDSSDAELGINFYSQWPLDNKKYTMMRKSDGSMKVYYCEGASDTLLGTLDDSASQAGVWYNYSIIVIDTFARAKVWPVTDSIEPSWSSISVHGLDKGTVGFTTGSGAGNRYFSRFKVVSNLTAPGAYMAYEDFKADTIVDVSPFVPYNWYPLYGDKRIETGHEVNGFTLDTTSGENALVYRHKPGVTYPATCLLVPETNLEWRNYEFSGTIIKPADPKFDSIAISMIIYRDSDTSWYALEVDGFNDSGTQDCYFKLRRYVGSSITTIGNINALSFSGDVDSVKFKVKAITQDLLDGDTEIKDGKIKLSAKVWELSATEPAIGQIENYPDLSAERRISGHSGIVFNNYTKASLSANGMVLKNIKIQKSN